MSGATDTDGERVYAAIEESARLLDTTCSRDRVWPFLNAFGDALGESMIVFSMAGAGHSGQLDVSFSVPAAYGDPYAIALSNGLLAKSDHPVDTLHADIREHCPIGMFGIDGEIHGGFKKIYIFFPKDELQSLAKLAEIPSMPRSIAENAELFARYGMNTVQMTSIDYHRRTVNLYFGDLPAECLEPDRVRALLRETGLPEPSEQALEFARKSFSIYPTLSWDSSKIERICLAVISTDQTALPARTEPSLAHFAKNAPDAYTDAHTLVYGLTVATGGIYYKMGSYYQISDHQRRLLKTFDALEGQA
jgi:hypothetical protein